MHRFPCGWRKPFCLSISFTIDLHSPAIFRIFVSGESVIMLSLFHITLQTRRWMGRNLFQFGPYCRVKWGISHAKMAHLACQYDLFWMIEQSKSSHNLALLKNKEKWYCKLFWVFSRNLKAKDTFNSSWVNTRIVYPYISISAINRYDRMDKVTKKGANTLFVPFSLFR